MANTLNIPRPYRFATQPGYFSETFRTKTDWKKNRIYLKHIAPFFSCRQVRQVPCLIASLRRSIGDQLVASATRRYVPIPTLTRLSQQPQKAARLFSGVSGRPFPPSSRRPLGEAEMEPDAGTDAHRYFPFTDSNMDEPGTPGRQTFSPYKNLTFLADTPVIHRFGPLFGR